MAKITEFDLAQYEWLKKEIEAEVGETRQLERNALLGSGATWLWLLTDSDNKLPQLAWWLPVGLIVLSAMRCAALYARIHPKATYMRYLEKTSQQQGGLLGWDRCLERQLQKGRMATLHLRLSGTVAIVFWLALLGFALWIASMSPGKSKPKPNKRVVTTTTTTTTTYR
ncbi:hypothetical protein E5K00_03800 [Hymenobacter aquaticus]|uniref:Uncharacterized protein n=1 Tax=Hymenobacter aquaticus TaxID=1867101 RepID=A0A4Z0Q4D7_9BACT|nr:hypothetical protein [Hymenobacter aquaticus]TGE24349.1 hypothetical protein E5K00_03800 [Hymenobacter aquaticus]